MKEKQVREGSLNLKGKIVLGLTIYCPFSCVKKLVYRIAGVKFGKGVYLGPKSVIISNDYSGIRIEDNVFFSYGVVVTAEDLIVGKGTHLGYEALITGKKIRIGAGCNINNRAFIEAYYAPVVLKDGVTVAGSVMISSHDGSLRQTIGGKMKAEQVVLEERSFVGNNAVVLPGVVLGKQCIVGAGAVVTKSVNARTVVIGVPAKEIKKI